MRTIGNIGTIGTTRTIGTTGNTGTIENLGTIGTIGNIGTIGGIIGTIGPTWAARVLLGRGLHGYLNGLQSQSLRRHLPHHRRLGVFGALLQGQPTKGK